MWQFAQTRNTKGSQYRSCMRPVRCDSRSRVSVTANKIIEINTGRGIRLNRNAEQLRVARTDATQNLPEILRTIQYTAYATATVSSVPKIPTPTRPNQA